MARPSPYSKYKAEFFRLLKEGFTVSRILKHFQSQSIRLPTSTAYEWKKEFQNDSRNLTSDNDTTEILNLRPPALIDPDSPLGWVWDRLKEIAEQPEGKGMHTAVQALKVMTDIALDRENRVERQLQEDRVLEVFQELEGKLDAETYKVVLSAIAGS